jgi:hypothetical protein
MKKAYQKPEIVFMHLRPEEKLAVCEWPVGFTSSGGGCAKTWQEVPAYRDMCMSMYNNAVVSGS